MEFHQFLKRADTCTDTELVEWIFRLEQDEIREGSQSIADTGAVARYREVRKQLVILRIELFERSR